MSLQRRVLLVEDDPDQNALFAQVLSMANLEAISVSDGESALQHLADEHFDLLLTDWFLPIVAGDVLIAKAKQQYPQMKTVLMSSHHHVHEAASTSGADGWFRKSDDIMRLLKLVSLLLCDDSPPAS